MRCFATADGHVLVEWATDEVDVRKPDGEPLGEASTFHLLDRTGALTRTWTTMRFAIQEHHTTVAHVIEGDCLVTYSHDERWRHENKPSLHREAALCGLRPLPVGDAPTEAEVLRAIRRAP